MKNKFINRIKNSTFLMLLMAVIVFSGCSDKGEGWADERYLSDFDLYIDHTNPLTGLPYTEEELAEKSYDPFQEERYAEGQDVVLDLYTDKMPSVVNVLSGTDLSIIESITEFSEVDGKVKTRTFSKTLAELGLLEIDDVTTIRFDVEYVDGSIGSQYFEIKKVEFFDPNSIIDTFVYLKKSNGQTIPLRIGENVSSRTDIPRFGSVADFDGASNKVVIEDVPELQFRHTDNYSIGFWVKTTSTDSDPVMIGDQDWASSGNPGLTIAFRGDNWRVATADGATKADTNHDGAFNDGEYHFLMVTFNREGNMTMYQDGASVSSTSMAGIGSTKSGNPLTIAQDGTGAYGQYFQGAIGNAYIYDYALTAEQAAAEATPLTGVQLRKQDGTVKNIPVVNSGGVISRVNDVFAYTFNGVDQYATIDDTDLGFRHTGDYSISFWVNTTSGDSDPVMIGDQNWASSGNEGLTIAFRGSNWRVATADGDTKADTDHNGGFNDGEWHLLTVVFDRDGDMSLYQDGNKTASTSMAAVGSTESGNPLRLAQDGTGGYGQFFEGSIAGTVIYDYALSAAQVALLDE